MNLRKKVDELKSPCRRGALGGIFQLNRKLLQFSLTFLVIFIFSAVFCTSSTVFSAADARFLSLYAGEEGDGWVATVFTDKKAKKLKDKIRFKADGEEVECRMEITGKRRIKAELRGIKEDAERITLHIGKRRKRPVAAVQIRPSSEESDFHDWIIYHIMVGMYRNGDRRNDDRILGWRHPNYSGGDLQGTLDSIEYLKALGINAVWLSPIFQARTSHGYDVENYYRIGDSVGVPGKPEESMELFRELVNSFHDSDIRIMLDMPLNHAGKYYDEKTGDPEELNPRATGPEQEAEELWDSWGSPYQYWNFRHDDTRKFLIKAVEYWLTQENVDGIRLDYVRGVPRNFWAELYSSVKKNSEKAFLMGECWIDDAGAGRNMRETAEYCEKHEGEYMFDSLLDFPMQITMTSVFARKGKARELEERLQKIEAVYGEHALPAYFLDNHDLARFASWNTEPEIFKAAFGFMMSLSGPVILFYGDETGLAAPVPKTGFTDAGRIPMPWNKLDHSLIESVSELIELRKNHPALYRGGRLPLAVNDDMLIMAKQTESETVLVGLNLSDDIRECGLKTGGKTGKQNKPDIPIDNGSTIEKNGEGEFVWSLPIFSVSFLTMEGAGACMIDALE